MFKKLNEQNWYVKFKKYALFLAKVEFLGPVKMKDGASIVDIKVSVVCNWLVPKTVQDLQVFLGLVKFYR